MKYKVLYKIASDEKEASKFLKEVADKAAHPFIHISLKTGYPLVCMYESDKLSNVEKAIDVYKQKYNLVCWIVKDV